MLNAEWRVLPLFRSLPEDVAISVFVLAHIPLIAVIVSFVASENERTRNVTKVAISAFLLLHGLGHWLSTGDPSYQFTSMLSSALIYGGASIGLAYLLLHHLDARRLKVS